MPPPEKPLPRPKPPKPKPKIGPGPKPTAARPRPQPERDVIPDRVPIMPYSAESCAYYRLCPPPPAPAATVHLSSGRLPTPLIALSASLLAASAVLLLALLVHRLVRRRRQRRRLGQAAPQEAPLAGQQDEEGGGHHHHQVLAAVAEEGADGEAGDGGVHHVWYIKTVGLDERAIAAIAAVVYDGKKRGGALEGGCAVCLAEFRDGETLRLLPRCRHAFHRGCIDTWLRAHVNCPLCRAPVQAAAAAANAKASDAAPGTAAAPRSRGEAMAGLGARAEDDAERGGVPDGAVRRAASMVALPRQAWPDVPLRLPSASSSAREEGMTGLGEIRRLLKLSDALEMTGVGVGRSVSFGFERCQCMPARSGPSAVAGVNGDDMELSR